MRRLAAPCTGSMLRNRSSQEQERTRARQGWAPQGAPRIQLRGTGGGLFRRAQVNNEGKAQPRTTEIRSTDLSMKATLFTVRYSLPGPHCSATAEQHRWNGRSHRNALPCHHGSRSSSRRPDCGQGQVLLRHSVGAVPGLRLYCSCRLAGNLKDGEGSWLMAALFLSLPLSSHVTSPTCRCLSPIPPPPIYI